MGKFMSICKKYLFLSALFFSFSISSFTFGMMEATIEEYGKNLQKLTFIRHEELDDDLFDVERETEYWLRFGQRTLSCRICKKSIEMTTETNISEGKKLLGVCEKSTLDDH